MKARVDQERFFGELEAHRNILFKITRSYCRRPADRDDLTQEIVIQLWRSYQRFDGRSKFSTWMYRVALNVAISFARSRKFAAQEAAGTDEELLEVADPTPGESEELRLLYEFIEALDPLNKAVALLYLDGNSQQEIADIVGISPSNVGTKIDRLKQRLRREFDAGNAN